MSCPEDTCYGVLAVHRICFALTLFHGMLAILLLRIHHLAWFDHLHLLWSGPTRGLRIRFRGLNRFFIIFNLILCFIVTCVSLHPAVREVNPGSGVIQSGVVVIYCTQLVTSAVANQDDGDSRCNPLTKLQEGTETSMVVLGAIMTLLAVAYTTFRAGTRSFEFMGMMNESAETGYVALRDADPERPILAPITAQPKKKDPLRIQAIQAAVDEGSLPAFALDDELRQDQDDDDNDREGFGALDKDDETVKVRYHYSSFHLIFVLATMYVAMLLTHWNIVTRIGHIPRSILRHLRTPTFVSTSLEIIHTAICLLSVFPYFVFLLSHPPHSTQVVS
ncbi:hypothetical protein PSHT_09819 [Puccinia striiformis]|uniref:Uncharacterized protein n=1 Tax=Puccinia striiformis TaxID=27350 RepID=A0A2S4VE20_9BASI|nr:hypothetical protein PSHT_09819 [Puccinia striiformis]